MCALAEPDLNQPPDDKRGANGDDDQCDGFCAFDRFNRQFFQQHADDGRHQNGQQQGDRERQTRLREEHGQHAPQHDELALRKVDDVAGVVNQREAQGGQRIGGADRDA